MSSLQSWLLVRLYSSQVRNSRVTVLESEFLKEMLYVVVSIDQMVCSLKEEGQIRKSILVLFLDLYFLFVKDV